LSVCWKPVIIIDDSGQPSWVLDADHFLRDALFSEAALNMEIYWHSSRDALHEYKTVSVYLTPDSSSPLTTDHGQLTTSPPQLALALTLLTS